MSPKSVASIEAIASEWLVRRDSATWTHADQLGFEAWLNESTLHRVTYLRLELAWEDAARLKALGAGVRSDTAPPPGQWAFGPFFERPASQTDERSSWRRRFGRSAPAAAAVLLMLIAAGLYVRLGGHGASYWTPVGGIATVTLRDGSQVTLNTHSLIHVTLSARERHVELSYGEAFFHVAKDSSRPFVVEAAGKRVIAVGTQFSVRRNDRNDRDLSIVVTEGRVRVDDAGTTLLTAGSIAQASDAGVLVRREPMADTEQRLNWRSGLLTFRDAPLADAVAEFNRYNVQQIIIADPAVANLRIEGNFRATGATTFVRLLESGLAVHARIDGQKIVLTAK